MPRRKQPGEPLSLAEIAIRRVGFRKAMKALEFGASWCIVCESLGHPPETVDEFSDWWRQSRAKGFREQALWREVFPELATPTPLWEQSRSVYASLFKGGEKSQGVLAYRLGSVVMA